MSEDVHYTGFLREVRTKNTELYAKRRLRDLGIKKDACYDTYLECLLDDYDNGFVEINEVLYAIKSKNSICPYSGHYKANRVGREIEYDVKYHNGGCGFTEALEEAITNMELNNE